MALGSESVSDGDGARAGHGGRGQAPADSPRAAATVRKSSLRGRGAVEARQLPRRRPHGLGRGKWSSLDRGVRTTFTAAVSVQPQVAADAVRAGLVHRRAGVQAGHARRPRLAELRADAAQPRLRPWIGLHACRSASSRRTRPTSISEEALDDPTFRDQLIALGLDPRTGEGGGRLGALTFDYHRSTTPQRARRPSRVRRPVSPRTRRQLPGGRIRLHRGHVRDPATTRRLGRLGVVATRGRIGTIDGAGPDDVDVPFFKLYFLGGSNSLRGWGRFEVSPLERVRVADRRTHHGRAVIRTAHAPVRQVIARGLRRCRQCGWPRVAARCVTLRRGVRPALPDTGGSVPRGLRATS